MAVEFGLRLMDRRERGAREFELAAGLDRDGAAPLLRQPDDVRAVEDRRPTERLAEFLQHHADAADAMRTVEGHGGVVGAVEPDLLVLGPDAMARGRLATRLQRGHEVAVPGDRGGIGDVARHETFRIYPSRRETCRAAAT